jgi:hypothetical protein
MFLVGMKMTASSGLPWVSSPNRMALVVPTAVACGEAFSVAVSITVSNCKKMEAQQVCYWMTRMLGSTPAIVGSNSILDCNPLFKNKSTVPTARLQRHQTCDRMLTLLRSLLLLGCRTRGGNQQRESHPLSHDTRVRVRCHPLCLH